VEFIVLFSFNSIFLKNINNNNNNKYFKNDYSKANFSDFKYIYKDDLFNKINKIK
jgi:hypothetical protein